MLATPFLIGLTGGIGSGKSTIADAFVKLGAGLVDTDAIAHALTAPGGAAIAPLRAEFGDEAITADGRLDRVRMRERVFADPGERQRLERILHPMIGAACNDAIAAAVAPYVLLAVPLLVESGNWLKRVDRVLVIDCDEATQISRVRTRGLSEDAIRAIMATQASRAQRRAAADDIIDNDSSLAAAQAQVAELHPQYLAMADAHRKRSVGNRP